MNNQVEKAEAFRSLHKGEPFLISNPWDVGSARVMVLDEFAIAVPAHTVDKEGEHGPHL